jgi:hypothetical protein
MKLTMLEIIEIFEGLGKLCTHIGSTNTNQMFIDVILKDDVREKFNILAREYIRFINSDMKKRGEMLGIKIKTI